MLLRLTWRQFTREAAKGNISEKSIISKFRPFEGSLESTGFSDSIGLLICSVSFTFVLSVCLLVFNISSSLKNATTETPSIIIEIFFLSILFHGIYSNNSNSKINTSISNFFNEISSNDTGRDRDSKNCKFTF